MRDSYNKDAYPADLSLVPMDELRNMRDDARSRHIMHNNAERTWNGSAVSHFQKEHDRLSKEIAIRDAG